jgi:hypothetical protein
LTLFLIEIECKEIVTSDQQDQPSVFDKFFKSFSDKEENKKQNEDNLNRIFDLLNKTTVVKKTESLLTTTTIIPTTDDEPILLNENNVLEKNELPVNEESSNLIKILLKIDTPTSSPTCSISSSTPETETLKEKDTKSYLKCPNNSKSSERLSVFSSSSSSLTSSKSSNCSCFISPLMSRTSKSLDENKSLSVTKENLTSTSSKSSPCISMKSNKNKSQTDNNLKPKSPNKNRKQVNSDKRFSNQRNGQKLNISSNQYRSFSSSNVNRAKETENNIRNKLKNINDLSKEKCLINQNFSSNLIPNYRPYQLPQQQIHPVSMNYGYDFSRPWPMSLNNHEQNHFHQQQQNFMNFDSIVNNRRYFPPYMLANSAQFHQKQIINNNLYKQQQQQWVIFTFF